MNGYNKAFLVIASLWVIPLMYAAYIGIDDIGACMIMAFIPCILVYAIGYAIGCIVKEICKAFNNRSNP